MNEIGRKITDKLIEINGSTDFSICFLPYKRSMWNSMESVYQECLNSGIDAHCVPIPYYRMKHNREIDYIDSDFEYFGAIAEPVDVLNTLNPRFCAIHYQYNNQNNVTNMLKEFYTENIKERYNSEIVMLPYGLALNPIIQEHSHLAPGLVSVDYLFCDTEIDRINCINAWKNYGIDYSDRVFAFGSPKIDSILKLKRSIPEEWQQAIGDRWVTLIINSLGPYINDPFKKIEKYGQQIYDHIIQGHAIIFRPHPLLRTTIKSMRSDTEEAYDQFIQKISKMEHVIIDESEYLERALSAADYLVCDPASILVMWKATGKPYKVI